MSVHHIQCMLLFHSFIITINKMSQYTDQDMVFSIGALFYVQETLKRKPIVNIPLIMSK